MTARNRPIKIVVVGDGTVGKTCLLMAYTTNTFPEEYVPTVFENYAGMLQLGDLTVNMTLWDTAGQEDYERLRPLSYPNTDVFLLCYSVDSKTSYDNISTKWSVEVKHHCPKAPLILVGLKTDLRQDSTKSDILTVSDGKRLKNKIKAEKYVECSAKTRDGLTEIFEEACRAALKQKPNTVKKNCILL